MTSAIPVHIALVDNTHRIDAQDLAKLSGVLNSQVQNDVALVWQVAATVGAYPTLPLHTWSIQINDQLPEPGALGYHTDIVNQPVAYVEYTDDYSVTVSHELIEMLADPFGNRMTGAPLPDDANFSDFGLASSNDLVQYLVELCDPCEKSSYPISGIAVSDFLLPAWYRSAPSSGEQYSHTGYCTSPRQIADGGYVSFANAEGHWFQIFNDGGQLTSSDLGQYDKSSYGGLREWIDQKAREYRNE